MNKHECNYHNYNGLGSCCHKDNTDIRSHGTRKKGNKKRCLPKYCPFEKVKQYETNK